MATNEMAQARTWFETAFSAESKQASAPFSFVYGGAPSSNFLTNWEVKAEKKDAGQGKEQRTLTYTDPATHLEIRCEATAFADSPAVEWVLYATNKGDTDTPVLEKLLPLNLDLDVPETGNVTLHYLKGSKMSSSDFLPMDTPLGSKGDFLARSIDLTATGGKSSSEWMPYLNLGYPGGGIVGAIGWSGQWNFQTSRADRQVHLQAGQQNFRIKLHPGETVRSPRMLLLFWKGDEALRGNNLFRRLMLAHYIPRINGEVALPPNALMTWFTHGNGNDVTEANQLAAIQLAAKAGCEAFWIDAGWYEGEGGWGGVGSWVPKPEAFPHGLKPLGDEAHRLGMKFIVWFEPERVSPGSRIAKEHPEWVLHSSNNPKAQGLFNLGDPAARAWMTDLLSKCIGDWGIDVLRIDFNIEPAAYWQSADTSDRKGIAEARYVEGLYKMWDDLKTLHPGLLIDNCASGGRRLDFELLSRSYPLWQSDTQCNTPPHPAWDQAQNAALSLYLPLHSGGLWAFDPYSFRSIATTGLVICPDLSKNKEDQIPQVRRMLEESQSLRPLALGDYYPLTEINSSEQNWCAWQYDRPDLGKGYIMVFRRSKSPFVSARLALHGLDPDADYVLTNADTRESKTVKGLDLARGISLEMPEPATNTMILYKKAERK